MRNAPTYWPAPDEFEHWELDLIERLVADFTATRPPAHDLEFEDLVQECLLHWWSQRALYDERRGASRQTFLRKVVRGKLLDIERGRKAGKRGSGRQPLSLDAPPSDDPGGPTIGEMLVAHAAPDAAFSVDWERLTATLSDRQRGIIAGVTAGMTKTALSKQFRISRDTIHEELKRIRQVFRDEGLAPHLE